MIATLREHASPPVRLHPSTAAAPSLRIFATAIIVLAITSRIGLIAWPFLNDSGLFAVLGRTVATGGVMYRDFYETKLPGAGLLAAGFWRAFGSCWAGYVLCQLVMALLAAFTLARTARRHVGPWAMPPTLLFAVVFLNFNYFVYTGFQLETIQAFFEAIAAAASIEAVANDDPFAAFAAGLAAGCAAMAKPGGIGVAIALMILLLRKNPFRIVAVLCGAAIPTLTTWYYTVQSGAWPYLAGVIRDINRYAAGTPVHAGALLKIGIVFCVLGWPFAAGLFGTKSSRDTVLRTVLNVLNLKKIQPPDAGYTPYDPKNRVTTNAPSTVLRFACLWFAVDLVAVIAQRRLYPYHFLPLACPAALLFGMLPGSRPIRLAIGLLPIALLSLTWEGSSLLNLHRGSQHMAISDYITTHTTAADTVFADQVGRLLIETNRNPGSRLGTFFYFVNDDAAPQDYCQILLEDFESRQPKYLVLADGWDRELPGLADGDILSQCPTRRKNFLLAWGKLRTYVAAHYVEEMTVNGQAIYRRFENSAHSHRS